MNRRGGGHDSGPAALMATATYTLCADRGLRALRSGSLDVEDGVELDAAAKAVGETLRGAMAITDLVGRLLVMTGPFGVAWFDVVLEGEQAKLRRAA